MSEPHVVCLGASAGGLEALERFFSALPADTGAAYVVVVHLSPDFKSLMPELLAKRTAMPVAAVTHNTPLEANHVYVIPPAQNLTLTGRRLMLVDQDRGPGHRVNLPIDLFFRQLADEFGERAIAVVLSGSGSDGSRGVSAIKERGGAVLVQDPLTASFDGMPRSALNLAIVDHTGDPADLAARVAMLCRTDGADPAGDHDEVNDVLRTVKRRTGTDLRWYRPRMIARRVQRRMAIAGISSLGAYRSFLETDAREVDLLRQDLLIGVTQFFRDPETFQYLQRYLASWLSSRDGEQPIRLWIPACSSGQEVYSLGMVLLEVLEAAEMNVPLRIFATDVNESAIARASRATYSYSEINDVPAALQTKYFRQTGLDYVIAPILRECIIFASHNVVTDPPFTKMDLVSCRNLLIYLDEEGQRRTLRSLHYAMRLDTGLLLLGKAETASALGEGVVRIDAVPELYRKVGETDLPVPLRNAVDPRPIPTGREADAAFRRSAVLEASFEANAVTGAIVSPDGRLVELVADPNGLFKLGKGVPTTQLSQLLSVDLAAAFTASVLRVNEAQGPVSLSVRGVGGRRASLRLIPLQDPPSGPLLLLEISHLEVEDVDEVQTLDDLTTQRIRSLEQEVHATRETLQSAIEELQSTNEEQQSTNEELTAANEELQSTNEELHSVNEELYTVNQEYQRKNDDLLTTKSDLDNLLKSTEVATLFLDQGLRVRRFSNGLERVLRLGEHDVGMSVREFAPRMHVDFVEEVETVIAKRMRVQREVRDATGAWLLMRIVPYVSLAGEPNGVIITFVEVTRIKHAEETARVLSQSLRDANRTLTSQTEELEDMFSIVAHDLRRPVLALDGQLTLACEAGPDEAQRHLQAATGTLRTLQRMLEDLATVSKQGREPPAYEDLFLEQWFDEMMGRFQARAEERGVRLQGSCDAGRVTFARAAAEVAFVNLVENAFIYGTSGDNPRIDVSCRYEAGQLTLIVSDNGRGIPRHSHNRVFELFHRLNPDEGDGSGVGLVSVKRMVQRAGGSVDVDSRPDGGARFIVVLPTLTAPTYRSRVLLVEDDEVDAKFVIDTLAELDIDVVRSLKDARRFVENTRFELVLLDLTLPDGHGLDLLPDLKEHLPGATVVIMTGLQGSVQLDVWDPTQVAAVLKKDVMQPAMVRSLIAQYIDLEAAAPRGRRG